MVESSKGSWLERLGIGLITALYLVLFRTKIASGDAEVYAERIAEGSLAWNPNHLLMDPTGALFHHVLQFFCEQIPVLLSLKILSAVSTVLSVLLFHWVLERFGVTRWLRVFGALGLLFSRNFLSMAVSEEFFMLQMPLLVLALGLLISLLLPTANSAGRKRKYFGLGALLGLACLIMANNVFLLAAIVLFILLISEPQRMAGMRGACIVIVGALAVAVPGVAACYLISGSDASIVSWLTSYGGDADSGTSALYGLKLSLRGVVLSGARVVYGVLTSFVDSGDLGAVAKAQISGSELEFVPSAAQVLLGGFLFLVILMLLGLLMIWILVYGRKKKVVWGALFWTGGYVGFNFLWNNSDDQFWFQTLPALWILIVLMLRDLEINRRWGSNFHSGRQRILLGGIIALLAVSNTAQIVAPLAFVDLQGNRELHDRLFAVDDLEVLPGWDINVTRWAYPDARNSTSSGSHRQMHLMELALKEEMENLPGVIDQTLSQGGRVIVGRLFDRDHYARPWDELRHLGWPRGKIIDLLREFDRERITVINGLSFTELSKGQGAVP